jgi:hypothetical protein
MLNRRLFNVLLVMRMVPEPACRMAAFPASMTLSWMTTSQLPSSDTPMPSVLMCFLMTLMVPDPRQTTGLPGRRSLRSFAMATEGRSRLRKMQINRMLLCRIAEAPLMCRTSPSDKTLPPNQTLRLLSRTVIGYSCRNLAEKTRCCEQQGC